MNEDGKQSDQSVGSVQLIDRTSVPVNQLSGFQKHHRAPVSKTDFDQRFIVDLSATEMDDDLQSTFSALRKAYGLKRKEIQVDGPSDGGGTILTPFFRYLIQIEQNTERPNHVTWTRSIVEISEPARVFAGPFEQVFGNRFSELEVGTHDELDLEAIVDHIEDAELDLVELDYDKDLTWCEINMLDLLATIRLENRTIQVTKRVESSPQELLETFLDVQQRFMSSLNMSGSSFLSAG
jgi:hypothetical protein